MSFGHVEKIGKRVIVLGGGNTAMDCCRTARRLGGEDVKVIVRSGFEEMKASPWEKEDALHEDIPILNFMVPKAFTHDNGKLTGVVFEKVKAEYDAKGKRNLVPSGEPDQTIECDDVLVAVGPLAAAMTATFGGEAHTAADAAEAAPLVRSLVAPGDLVLVKASRGVRLEAVTQALATA